METIDEFSKFFNAKISQVSRQNSTRSSSRGDLLTIRTRRLNVADSSNDMSEHSLTESSPIQNIRKYDFNKVINSRDERSPMRVWNNESRGTPRGNGNYFKQRPGSQAKNSPKPFAPPNVELYNQFDHFGYHPGSTSISR
jgi:hypothetical protein